MSDLHPTEYTFIPADNNRRGTVQMRGQDRLGPWHNRVGADVHAVVFVTGPTFITADYVISTDIHDFEGEITGKQFFWTNTLDVCKAFPAENILEAMTTLISNTGFGEVTPLLAERFGYTITPTNERQS